MSRITHVDLVDVLLSFAFLVGVWVLISSPDWTSPYVLLFWLTSAMTGAAVTLMVVRIRARAARERPTGRRK